MLELDPHSVELGEQRARDERERGVARTDPDVSSSRNRSGAFAVETKRIET